MSVSERQDSALKTYPSAFYYVTKLIEYSEDVRVVIRWTELLNGG